MRILFVGLGNLGSQVFDLFLLRSGRDDRFLVAGRNQPYLQQRISLTAYAAMQLGLSPHVEQTFMDIWNVEQTAQTIWSFKPDVIFSSATVQPSSAISKLPQPIYEKLAQAKAGPWLPLTLVLVFKLMQAVKQTGLPITVLNGAAPDNAHAVLSDVGLAPTTGVGNLANIIPALKKAIAIQLNKPMEDVQVLLFGHNQVAHGIRVHGTPGVAPFHLTALMQNEDVTDHLDLPALFNTLPATLGHEYTQLLSAASAASVFDAITTGSSRVVHAPGPNGLPGAYPIRADQKSIEVVLPSGLTLEEAIRINQAGQRLDGIERIESDGTVYFTEQNMSILKETLGYECRRMPLSEGEERAKELHARYLAYASQFL